MFLANLLHIFTILTAYYMIHFDTLKCIKIRALNTRLTNINYIYINYNIMSMRLFFYAIFDCEEV